MGRTGGALAFAAAWALACAGPGGAADTGSDDLPFGLELGGTTDVGSGAACRTTADCDDQNPCTADTCAGGRCRNVPIDGCCQADSDCDDQDVCTTDACQDRQCVHTPRAACCHADADCDDHVACTTDTCLPNGNCQNVKGSPTCCAGAGDCDDGDACTIDTCTSGETCEHDFAVSDSCCHVDSDCSDGNAQTDDTCVRPDPTLPGHCVHVRVICSVDADCAVDPPDVCSTAACTGFKCTVNPVAGCCTTDAGCDDQDACTADTCGANTCGHVPVAGCCHVDADCAVTTACKVGSCTIAAGATSGTCTLGPSTAPECCVAGVLAASFDDGMDGFAVTPLYPGPVTWTRDTKRASSAPYSLYFGDPATHTTDYVVGGLEQRVGALADAAVDLSTAVAPFTLTFQVFKATGSLASEDVLSVVVTPASGSAQVAWSTTTDPTPLGMTGFLAESVDLSGFAGQAVRVGFRFDSIGTWNHGEEGVYVDDVVLTGKCSL
jgi:hypothetical protein